MIPWLIFRVGFSLPNTGTQKGDPARQYRILIEMHGKRLKVHIMGLDRKETPDGLAKCHVP